MDNWEIVRWHCQGCPLNVKFEDIKRYYLQLSSELSLSSNLNINEYLEDQVDYFSPCRSNPYSTCNCQDLAAWKPSLDLQDLSEYQQKYLGCSIVNVMLEDPIMEEFSLKNASLWKYINSKPKFVDYSVNTLKSIFRDKMYGNLNSIGFSINEQIKFSKVINNLSLNETNMVQYLQEMALEHNLTSLSEKDFWEEAFFNFYMLFDTSKTFSANVNQLEERIEGMKYDSTVLFLTECALSEN